MLYLVRKQVYKFKLSVKERILNMVNMLWLEQDIIKKGQINKFLPEFKMDNVKDYELEAI